MTILDRYVLRAWLGAVIATALALLGFVLIADLVSHLDEFMGAEGGSPLTLAARYYGVRLPVFFVWIAPMISLCSIMLVVTRFARTNELLPVVASGISLRRFLAPALVGTAGVSVAMFLVDEKVNPRLAEEFRDTQRMLKGDREIENVVISDRQGQDWLADRYHPVDFRLERVLVVRLGESFHRVSDVRAEQAVYRRSLGGWLLERGVETAYDPLTQRRTGRKPLPPEGLVLKTDLRPAEIEESDQMFRLSTMKQLNRNMARFPFQPFWRVQWHAKWTMPLANLVLMLIGVPLLLRMGTRNVFAGVAIAVGVGIVFFGTTLAFLDAGNSGRVDPAIAAWFPVVLFGALGLAMSDAMAT